MLLDLIGRVSLSVMGIELEVGSFSSSGSCDSMNVGSSKTFRSEEVVYPVKVQYIINQETSVDFTCTGAVIVESPSSKV